MSAGALCPAVSDDGKSVCINLKDHGPFEGGDGHVWDKATPGQFYLQACALCGGEIRVIHGDPQPHPCGEYGNYTINSVTIALPDGRKQTITNPGFLGLLTKDPEWAPPLNTDRVTGDFS